MVEKIKPDALRVECQKCGGWGHVVMQVPVHYETVNYTHIEPRRVTCKACSGRGWNKPRRPIR